MVVLETVIQPALQLSAAFRMETSAKILTAAMDSVIQLSSTSYFLIN